MPNILVVDDTAVDRRLAGGLLQKSPNLSVSFAENGSAALESIKSDAPDLVLTDLQMPDLDGLELVTSIVASNPEIPVVLMTAHGSEVVAAQALANGAASYVHKSDLADRLVETVTQILAMSIHDRKFHSLAKCAKKTEFEFELENDPTLIEPLVELVQQFILSMELCDATERVRTSVALESAIENAMLRGNLELSKSDSADHGTLEARMKQEPYCNRKTNVKLNITRDSATFVVSDQGQGFDTDVSPKPGDPQSLRNEGRGLVLMRNFMDECIFNDSGNSVTLVKHRKDT